jgi:hypothetical protein
MSKQQKIFIFILTVTFLSTWYFGKNLGQLLSQSNSKLRSSLTKDYKKFSSLTYEFNELALSNAKKIFSQNCLKCHQVSELPQKEVNPKIFIYGIKSMPHFRDLNHQDLADITNYLNLEKNNSQKIVTPFEIIDLKIEYLNTQTK